jgi:hypothetical protein
VSRGAGVELTATPMVWSPKPFKGGNANDAEKRTHKAITPALQELWAKVANERLEKDGDEGRAIREANAVVARQAERNS